MRTNCPECFRPLGTSLTTCYLCGWKELPHLTVGIDPPKPDSSLPIPKADEEKATTLEKAVRMVISWRSNLYLEDGVPPECAMILADMISRSISKSRAEAYADAARVARSFRDQWKNAAGFHNFATAALNIATAIEAKAKEVGNA